MHAFQKQLCVYYLPGEKLRQVNLQLVRESSAQANKSLDASGGSVFRIIKDAAMLE